MKTSFYYKGIAFLVLIAIVFRLWMISGNKIYFWYDQARDAYVSQEILKGDFKIQGPSASGTNDTIYHGVLYYYLLAPLYFLGSGNPAVAAQAFAFLNSLALIPLYVLATQLSNSKKVGLAVSILCALNFQHSQYSTWLSNPAMSLLPIPVFFLSVWHVFYKKEPAANSWYVSMGLALGTIQQSAFYSFYLWGVIIIASLYNLAAIKRWQAFLFLVSYMLIVSSMIITQVKLYQAGIFTIASFTQSVTHSASQPGTTLLQQLLEMVSLKFGTVVLPSIHWVGTLLFCLATYLYLRNADRAQKYFVLSWLTAPLWLLTFHFRTSQHLLVGMEYLVFLFLGAIAVQLWRKKTKVPIYLLGLILVVSTIDQFRSTHYFRTHNMSMFTYQKGVLLEKQLELITYTYEAAQKKPFSVSLWVSPYEYYISWAYLYDWYGNKKYGYVPTYYGESQVGKYGPELMAQKDYPASIHYVIEEPQISIPESFYKEFISRQEEASTLKERLYFGDYSVENRVKRTAL